MFWTPHEYNFFFFVQYLSFHIFSAFYMVCTTQKQEINPTKKTKHADNCVMIRTRMPKKTITIRIINSHISPKKKIIQTEIHEHSSNFENSKSMSDYIVLLKIAIFILIFMRSSCDVNFYYDL